MNQLWAQDRAEKGRQWIWRGKEIIRSAGVEHEQGVYRGWEGVGSRERVESINRTKEDEFGAKL